MKTRFEQLQQRIQVTLHSRSLFNDASVIYNHPHLHDEVKRAWAVWVLGAMGFAGILDGSWGYERKSQKVAKRTNNRREYFTQHFAIRLQNVQIECADALYIIESRDSEQSFFYVDPPYYNADMGHYDGYTIDDFEKLLIKLGSIKGKFLLSSYPSPILEHYIKQNQWTTQKHEYTIAVGKINGKRKKKIEVLTRNY